MRHGEHELLEAVLEVLEEVRSLLRRLQQSTTAVLGVDMASTATLTFVDKTGSPAAPPKGDGSGLNVVFSSDNAAVSVGTATASGNEAMAPITGTEAFNLSAVVSNTSGAALLDDDGTTFVQPSPIAVAAVVVPATTATLSAT